MNRKLFVTCLITGTLAFGNYLQGQTTTPPPSGPTVFILATDPTALEGTTSGSFTLIRDGDTNGDLTVDVTFLGTASNGVDYATIPNTLVIPNGFRALDIPVTPIIDTNNRGNKTVIATVQANANYEVGRASTAIVKIVDDVFNTPPPTVAITDPASGSSIVFGVDVSLTAVATDPGANIEGVSFYANDTFLGKVTNAPYTFMWELPDPGRYTIFARAVDDLNQSASSEPVSVIISDPAALVVITTPTNGQTFPANQNITVAATATESGLATIESVSFFANGRLLGKSTTAPYQITWNSVRGGNYTLQATATDNGGKVSYSKRSVIMVGGR
jgi:hypothetical protein